MKRGEQGPPIVNVDLSAMESKLDMLGDVVSILSGMKIDNADQARKQKRATEDSGKSR
jgi:hypothetical protein